MTAKDTTPKDEPPPKKEVVPKEVDVTDIKVMVEDTFVLLNELETRLETEYETNVDNPSLVAKLRAIRNTRTMLNEAFPSYETTPE